ncbi:hypothetical protein D1631_18445 [Chryseobacterium nematophagum]|uniref:DUF4410 domain-containing protein n=1 Tax=Chryseobacterium nematophagum TaxID=2305228 RepID=A0A3M7TC02_9FLAO|nr:hypothetical protein [Chryseobacterium nematophagum]RNA60474.1 hypothetical protein D1631_18445 [Chryseobacterium nematophagum]
MKKLLTFLFVLFLNLLFSQKQVYKMDNLESYTSKHKTVAILPFTTSITYKKLPKDFNEEANKQEEITMSKNIQSSLYTYLLAKNKKYTIDFQDINKTNILLKKAGIESLDETSHMELAKLLGVDAVIGGKFDISRIKSDAWAIASDMLLGFGGKTGSHSLTMSIYDGDSEKLIWRFYNQFDDNYLKSTDYLVESMMKKVSRNFPYRK